MTLLTVAAYVARIGELEADNVAGSGPRGARVLDEAKIDGALDFATSLIAGKLRARFPDLTGLAPMPEILLGICQDIATYRLRYKTGDQSGVQDETRARYAAALKLLDEIAAGRLQLGTEDRGADQQPVLASGERPRAETILAGWR